MPIFCGMISRRVHSNFQVRWTMKQYLDLLRHIRDNGMTKDDRTGTCTISVFGYQMRCNLQDGFPLLTTKKLYLRAIIHELLWFLMGETNIKYLNDNKVSIWNDWADETGELGPVYGYQWRNWPTFKFIPGHPGPTSDWEPDQYKVGGIDQITELIHAIKTNPDSRRHIVSAWNVADVDKMGLPPCHCLFQFYVVDGKLSCQLYQRSADVFLGVPFNTASYALLTMMVAQVCDLVPWEFIHTFGDVHIYLNHQEQVETQLNRQPRELPIMHIDPDVKDIFSFTFEDFILEGYNPHPAIKAPIAV